VGVPNTGGVSEIFNDSQYLAVSPVQDRDIVIMKLLMRSHKCSKSYVIYIMVPFLLT